MLMVSLLPVLGLVCSVLMFLVVRVIVYQYLATNQLTMLVCLAPPLVQNHPVVALLKLKEWEEEDEEEEEEEEVIPVSPGKTCVNVFLPVFHTNCFVL